MPIYAGQLTRDVTVIYYAQCFECRKTISVDRFTAAAASKVLREVYDWSFGRDKKWRCKECRPRRFGEKS